MGSDESHFNVSLIVMGKVTRQYPHIQLLKRKESRSGFEPRPSAYQPNALPLGQTGSLTRQCPQTQLLKRKEIRIRIRTEVPLPLRGSHRCPSECRSHSVTLEIIFPFTYLPVSWSTPLPLRRQFSVNQALRTSNVLWSVSVYK